MDRASAAVIVERRRILREALYCVVGGRLKVVASISSLRELDNSALAELPSVLVVLGSGAQPEIVLHEIRSHREQRRFDPIVVLSDAENSEVAASFMRAGADAYLEEPITADLLLKALDVILMGKSVLPRGILARILGGRMFRPRRRSQQLKR